MAGVKGKSGGPRPNAGRKPSVYTQLKRRVEAERVSDAERAFDLYVQVMDNAEEPIVLRLQAADWITNRVQGKPKERIESDNTNLIDDVSKLPRAERQQRIAELVRRRGN